MEFGGTSLSQIFIPVIKLGWEFSIAFFAKFRNIDKLSETTLFEFGNPDL
jgi:hypothetical protein